MEAESEESSDDNNHELAAANFDQYTSQKRRRQDQFQESETNQYDKNSSDESIKSIDNNENESNIPSEDDCIVLSDDEILIEQFTAPDNDLEFEYPDISIK